MSGAYTHRPVLLEEAIQGLAIRPDGVYVDGTLGRGGHSEAIVRGLTAGGRLLCIDRDSRLDKLNKFPQDITFQTFLLDRDNKVKVIGNPVHNLAVKDLYLKQMTGKISPGRDRIKTTAKAINSEVDFGAFSKSEEKTAVFEIENTGDNPLVILDISTTCGCTTANYDKHPAKPGERLRIEVRMTPKDTGLFDEIVTLKCNTASPVKVKIRGQVQ